MKPWLADKLSSALAHGITVVVMTPLWFAIIWLFNYGGWIAWADFPPPSLKQMFVLAVVAAALSQ